MLSNEQNQARTDRERGLADQRERFRPFDCRPMPQTRTMKTIPQTTVLETYWAIVREAQRTEHQNYLEDRAPLPCLDKTLNP